MNESKSNELLAPKSLDEIGKSGETVTVTCDELVEFNDNSSQPAGSWPWPEPAFVPQSNRAKPKD